MSQEFDNRQAFEEGWSIFSSTYGGTGKLQIQRDDDSFAFEDDSQAWEHVVRLALAGSAYHRSALELIDAQNPEEAAAIREHCAQRGLIWGSAK